MVILIYGETDKPTVLGDHSFIDITRPKWREEFQETEVVATRKATMLLKRVAPDLALKEVSSIQSYSIKTKVESPTPDLETKSNETDCPQIISAKAGPIIISNKYNPAVEKAPCWLTPYHLELMSKLLGEGVNLELLNEDGKVVKEIKK